MILLAIGVGLFAFAHLVPAVPAAKAYLRMVAGEKLYGPLFGAMSIVALALAILGWRQSEFVPIYEPASWGRHVNFALSAVAFVFLGVFVFRGVWRQRVRFPLAMGVALWGTGHLFANGDRASLILFGGLLAYSLAYLALGWANGVRPTPEVRSGHDMLSVLFGIAFYGVMIQAHPLVTGVPVLVLSR